MYSMLDPAGMTVLVTGASSGFGLAAARRFAGAGARVVAAARRAERLEALQGEFGELLHPLVLDVRDKGAVQAAIDNLPEEFAALDVLVANAGLALGLHPAQSAEMDDWETMVATNISGLMYTVRAVLPGMVARKSGHVISVGSVAGDFPYPGGNAYGASKAFVKQFALGLFADLAGTGVRSTNIEPGLAETEFSLVRFHGDGERAGKVYDRAVSLSAEDVAESIFWAACLPAHVNVNRIQLMPVSQTFAGFSIRRDEV
jgi:3-hydroxy acid dehydrogenase / malonic semialdehyde reductase